MTEPSRSERIKTMQREVLVLRDRIAAMRAHVHLEYCPECGYPLDSPKCNFGVQHPDDDT